MKIGTYRFVPELFDCAASEFCKLNSMSYSRRKKLSKK